MSSFKQVIKKVTPQIFIDIYLFILSTKESFTAFSYDRRRFIKNYARPIGYRTEKSHIEARMVFHAHSIEKGLSHNKIRLGFGRSALRSLASNMDRYTKEGYPKNSAAYSNSLSVLKAYIELHRQKKFRTDYISKYFSDSIISEALADTSGIGGASVVRGLEKSKNSNLNFKELFTNRWSVREYSNTKVDMSRIDEAIEISLKSPSICNRQSSRVTVLYDHKKIETVLKLQGGLTSYALPPVLIMITTDTTAFVGINERNQVWIDGGLFAMSLLLSLEYVSLAACPLNAMLSIKNDKKMRDFLNIPPSENIIMFISVGNFLKESGVPKSFRYSKELICKEI